MYARIQTWFPFHIQIGINGREWLAQQMRQAGLAFQQEKNCFTRIADFQCAQEFMNQQLQTDWVDLLTGFAQRLNPIHEEIFAQYPTPYYWTCYQSEWATDIVFQSGEQLKRLMPALIAHGLLSFHSSDILRFFGKRTTQAGRRASLPPRHPADPTTGSNPAPFPPDAAPLRAWGSLREHAPSVSSCHPPRRTSRY